MIQRDETWESLQKVSCKRILDATFTATTASAAQDIVGINRLMFVYTVTTATTLDASNYYTLSFTECDTVGGSYTAVPAERVYVNQRSTAYPQPLITEGSEVVLVVPREQFIKAVLTETGTAEVVATVDMLPINLTAKA